MAVYEASENTKTTESVPMPGGEAEITVPCEGCVVVSLIGEHDMTTAPRLRSVIAEQASRSRGTVVSVSQTDFIDSAVVCELFQGDQAMLKIGRRLVLHLDAKVIVERVLEIGGVLAELMWTESLPEAIEWACQADGRLDHPGI